MIIGEHLRLVGLLILRIDILAVFTSLANTAVLSSVYDKIVIVRNMGLQSEFGSIT